MRYGIILCLVLVLGCGEIDYEDNERLLIEGRVIDNNETPIPDLTINVYPGSGIGFIANAEPIGSGISLSDGSFSIVTLSPKTSYGLSITVNENFRSGHRPEYSSETIRDIGLTRNKNYTYTVPKITVKTITGTSSNTEVFKPDQK